MKSQLKGKRILIGRFNKCRSEYIHTSGRNLVTVHVRFPKYKIKPNAGFILPIIDRIIHIKGPVIVYIVIWVRCKCKGGRGVVFIT